MLYVVDTNALPLDTRAQHVFEYLTEDGLLSEEEMAEQREQVREDLAEDLGGDL